MAIDSRARSTEKVFGALSSCISRRGNTATATAEHCFIVRPSIQQSQGCSRNTVLLACSTNTWNAYVSASACTPPDHERQVTLPPALETGEEHWGKKRQLPVPPVGSASVSEVIANTVHTVGSGDDTLIKDEDNVSIPVPHFSLNTPLSRYPGWFV